ncbi:AlpA family transcriptional regulator [Paracoccus sp. (in: a-proteobacteria)]|uniref:helix-turn-helix transcriptional regulator n=1 Tax=Paracoccus sp. TaxID=267 RepID=UPI0026E035C6|nr:AlpA family phage regulatory protein [Paracoccus sp. (in: a-proteobacteria)]MDO5646315.1 AlpA family phage regulatory protein [Paracoccus sp. (in: a-proteobacteria)]
MQHDTLKLMRLPDVLSHLSIGKTTLYDMVKRGDFPAPIKLGRASFWSSDQVSQWISGRAAK